MRGPHDVGGLPDGPVETCEHTMTFWERQIDALRGVIGGKGIVVSHENRRAVEQLGHDAYERLNYYERWTATLSRQMVEKGYLTQDEIDQRVQVIRERLQRDGELELADGNGKG
jgi:hypothetical protein